MHKIYVSILLGFLALGLLVFFAKNLSDGKGGYLVPVSQITSSQVSCGGSISGATTSLWATGGNFQRVYLDNLGIGNVYIAFGTDATTSKGFHLYPIGSSTAFSARELADLSLLAKMANCVANPTSTVNLFSY